MPSKKIIVILIICLGAVASVWLIEHSLALSAQKKALAQAQNGTPGVDVTSEDPRPTFSTVDSDGDGLYDWQEILIGTDPHNPDTDGDGTPDGAEIAQGRDPLKKGPNDKNPNVATILALSGNTNMDGSSNPVDGTLTDQMSKDFFGQYLNVVSSTNGQVSSDDANQIALNTLSSPKYTKINGAVYSEKNIHITQNTDATTVRNYKIALLTSLDKHLIQKPPLQNELKVVAAAMVSEKESDLSPLVPIVAAYTSIINDLLTMQVPKDAVPTHIAFLNATSNILASIQSMQTVFSDPVRSFGGLSQYQQYRIDFKQALKNDLLYITAKGVSIK